MTKRNKQLEIVAITLLILGINFYINGSFIEEFAKFMELFTGIVLILYGVCLYLKEETGDK